MFSSPAATVYVPDGLAVEPALARCTRLGVGAHQDDLEFMAFHGILACFEDPNEWFGGVTATDGGGSSRTGPYAACSDGEMRRIRITEQENAARLGRYGVMIQLGHPSEAVKKRGPNDLTRDLSTILATAKPQVVYCHNPADKHDTHIGVLASTIDAIRSLPPADRPLKIYGCEGWRDLDWLTDDEKVALDVGGNESLAVSLNAVFASQIAGGKRYDLAVMGRRRANATFFNSHASDGSSMITFAMDLSPLAQDDSIDLVDFTLGHIDRLRSDVETRLRRQLGR